MKNECEGAPSGWFGCENLRACFLLASLACVGMVSAQNQPEPSAIPSSPLQGKAMTTDERVKQLKPATNLVELMQLLKTVHEQALLIAPSFMEDSNIFRLFGEGTIQETRSGTKPDDLYFKRFNPSRNNPLRFSIMVSGKKVPPGYGGITIGSFLGDLPFNYELIENHLLPGVDGDDPLGPLKPMTNEARNLAGGRPLATHRKGYLEYMVLNRAADYRARIDVRLTRNAEVKDIDLEQFEVTK